MIWGGREVEDWVVLEGGRRGGKERHACLC